MVRPILLATAVLAAAPLPAQDARDAQDAQRGIHRTVSRPVRTAAIVGGASLILAAVLFMGVFSWLASAFGYPEVLDGSAAEVLPRLLALGRTGQGVWALYALVPLLLVPGMIGTAATLDDAAPRAMQAARLLGALAALAMALGLARWPTLHWALAEAWGSAPAAARVAIAAVFDGANRFLGNFVGEFLGELFLNASFVLVGIAAWRSPRWPRWAAWAALVTGVLGLVGAWRNVTGLVAGAAAADNLVLPAWLVAQGVLAWRAGRARAAADGA